MCTCIQLLNQSFDIMEQLYVCVHSTDIMGKYECRQLRAPHLTSLYAYSQLPNSLSLYTAPVIGTFAAKALSLSDVQVTVTLSDNGGQPVEEYTVSFVNDL